MCFSVKQKCCVLINNVLNNNKKMLLLHLSCANEAVSYWYLRCTTASKSPEYEYLKTAKRQRVQVPTSVKRHTLRNLKPLKQTKGAFD